MGTLSGDLRHHIDLWRLAQVHGIKPAYTDVQGVRHRAEPDAILHALRSLGVDIQRISEARAALRKAHHQQAATVLQPVLVAWDGERQMAVVRVPERHCTAGGRWAITLHDGGERAGSFDLGRCAVAHARELEGERFIDLKVPLPHDLPVGYHHAELEIAGQVHSAHLFVAPPRAFGAAAPDRSWGVFLPLYALHSGRSWGIGDLTDLSALADWTATCGAQAVGTLPLLAQYLDEPCMVSPYTPVSRMFFNELYLDVAAVPEFRSCEPARRLAASLPFQSELASLSDAEMVDYQHVMAAKRRVLELLAEHFFARSSKRRESFDKYLAVTPQAAQYAEFRAVTERLSATWSHWPKRLRQGTITSSDYDPAVQRYHLYVQWLVHEQLAAVASDMRASGQGLYLDLPVGVHPEGYDRWRFRDDFITGASAGAPPDELFSAGQDWGLTPLHPQRTRLNGHAYFRACVAAHLQFASLLRIDHVMGLHRLYWAPHGMSPRQGVYVRYPAEELYAILCIESHRAQARIVGENLGTVPASVNSAMARRGIAPLYVAQFSWTDAASQPLAPPPKGAVASLNTHDVPMFAAYWQGDDIDMRLSMELLDAQQAAAEHRQRAQTRTMVLHFADSLGISPNQPEVVRAMRSLLQLLGSSQAGLVLVNLEDLWLERRPQNVPGTQLETNWRRRATYSLEHMRAAPEVNEVLIQLISHARQMRKT